MFRSKLSRFRSYLLLVIEVECIAFLWLKAPSLSLKGLCLSREMVANAAVKPARAIVTKSVNRDLFNMTLESKV